MAQRQAPQTTPVLDNSALDAVADSEKSRVVHALSKAQYSSLIYLSQTLELTSATAILNVTKARLRELGVPRILDRPHRKKAKGSSQFDPGSFQTWVRNIKPDDVESIKQLQGIDATVALRFPDDKDAPVSSEPKALV